MSKRIYVALVCLCVVMVSLGVSLERNFDQDYPSDMRFIMYCEECAECGNKEKEVEYSIVSNVGYSVCKNCDSHYEFELNDKGEKVIINEN